MMMAGKKLNSLQYLGQFAAYALFALLLGYFSESPKYRHMEEGKAVIKLSISHAGKIVGKCRKPTAEELAGLPRNMRMREICPRERSPVSVELVMNGDILYRETIPPSGFQKDGVSVVYKRFAVPAGDYLIEAKLKDQLGDERYDYVTKKAISLKPRQVVVIDFHPNKNGFIIN